MIVDRAVSGADEYGIEFGDQGRREVDGVRLAPVRRRRA